MSKTGSGTQANLDSARLALRIAEARVNTSQTRLARRSANAPVAGTVHQIYFREGEMVPQQRPVLSILPPGNMKVRFFVPETDSAEALGRPGRAGDLRRLCSRSDGEDLLHRDATPNTRRR